MILQAENYIKSLKKLMVIDDEEAVHIFLAVVAAHKTGGNMFWFRIIGPSGSGKSELLKSIQDVKDYCISADTFTPGAWRGGKDPEKGEKLPRMLEQWTGKLVLTKDLASVINKKKEERNEVFGLIRNAWDGTLDAYYGTTEGHVHLKFHFDWILATTPYIERQRSLEAELGSRFIDMQWRLPKDPIAAILTSGDNDRSSSELRKSLSNDAGEFVSVINPIDKTFNDRDLATLAHLTSVARTPVYRDGYQNIYDIPVPELGTRIYQGMRRIVIGLIEIGVDDYRPYMYRLALDCLPRIRRSIIESFIENPKIRQEDMAAKCKVSQPTIHTALQDLKLLGFQKEQVEILEKFKGG